MTQNANTKEVVKLTNRSRVYEVFGDGDKLTIREITHRVNDRLDHANRLSEQTIRRAVTSLCKVGQLKEFGKSGGNAQTYGKLSATFAGDPNDELVPFGGKLVGVGEFVKLMTDPDLRPLKKNVSLLSEKSQHGIRRMMLFAILSAGEAGNSEALKSVNTKLHTAIQDLEFALTQLRGFVDSAVWFEDYRDKIGLAVRELTKEDPELFKLAVEYMKSE